MKNNRLSYSIKGLTLILGIVSLMFSSFLLKEHTEDNPKLECINMENYMNNYLVCDTSDRQVYFFVDEMPRFSGCEDLENEEKSRTCTKNKLEEFIYSNLEYPELAKSNGVEGTIVARFIIQKNGQVEDVEIVKGIGGGCDQEAFRIVNLMPIWIPGKQRGTAVDVQYNLPIKFTPEIENVKSKNLTRKEKVEDVERMPRFPGCEDELGFEEKDKIACAQKEMLEFLYSNLIYPKKARRKGIEGTAVIRFLVKKTGEIADATIVREIGGGCGKEALRIVKMMPDWLPGYQNEKFVEVEFNMPIKFKLGPEVEKKEK